MPFYDSEKEIGEDEEIECIVCKTEVQSYWDSRYNGFRGSCSSCGFNWAES